MKFFVDTADVVDIRDLADAGLLDGVTTNPSLIAKSGRAFKEVIAEKSRVVLDTVCSVGGKVVIDGEAMVMAPSRAKREAAGK